MGNVHDAFPRQLFLDTLLSPLDKTAWVMIRLYAQQNEGVVFPTYDELQVQLASAHSEKASRDTVSRVLLMLRLTGWLSLCKRVRDDHGCVRGNIYAQHDEPLGYRDAETFDSGWLTLVEKSCLSRNKAVRMTALAVVNDILMGALAIGLLVCVGAFFAVAHAVITAFHDIRRGKGEWTQFLVYLVVGIILILLVIYLATKASDIL